MLGGGFDSWEYETHRRQGNMTDNCLEQGGKDIHFYLDLVAEHECMNDSARICAMCIMHRFSLARQMWNSLFFFASDPKMWDTMGQTKSQM